MITKIKWKNHNILGNLELDFTKDGKPCNTIVIAGENGTGKTTILEMFYNFLYRYDITHFDYVEYEIGFNKFKLWKTMKHGGDLLKRSNHDTGEEYDYIYGHNLTDEFDVRSYGVLYSKAHSGFKTETINSITSTELDRKERNSNDDEEDFTKIKQLLVDINSQDNSNLSGKVRVQKELSSTEYEIYEKNSKMYRFKNAFNGFFENIIQFDRVDEQDYEKRIIFKKYGKEITIDSLSTGEKQIVFRGSYLLQDQKQMDGGIILIDEPELSMHPLWQEKILDYYRNLFKTDDKQNVQMIVATHSEYVIKSALEDKENVLVIKLKNDNGLIEGEKNDSPSILNKITLAETNYEIFNIVSVDYNMQLYGYLQDITNNTSVKGCDKYIEEYINNNNKDQSLYIKPSFRDANTSSEPDYKTLPTLIRNSVSHYDNGNEYNGDTDLRLSIELLIEIIKSCQQL